MPTALINLKTNFRELKYGNDRPDGGSSNQPYIITGIPGGEDFAQDLIEQKRANDTPLPDAADFILRDGYLAAVTAFKDGERLGKYFIDLKTPSGLLFTLKQQLLERQNPDVDDDINRIYNPLGTVLQAGVLPIGYHLNKQGFNVFRLGYNDGGTAGYYPITNTQKNPSVVSDHFLNRLAASYIIKITSNETAPNFYNIDELDDNVLLSYPGGPNSFLGIGKTKIRIQNPTRPVESVSNTDKFQPSYFSTELYNPKYLTPNVQNPFVNYVYNPFLTGNNNIVSKFLITFPSERSAALNLNIDSNRDENNIILNQSANTVKVLFPPNYKVNQPGNRYFIYGDNLIPETEIQYFNSIDVNNKGTSSLQEGGVEGLVKNDVRSLTSFPYVNQSSSFFNIPGQTKGEKNYLIPSGSPSLSLTYTGSFTANSVSATQNQNISKEDNVGTKGRFIYSTEKSDINTYLTPSSSTNNISASVPSSNPQNASVLQGTIPSDVKVLDGKQTRNIGDGTGQHWIGNSKDNTDKPASTNYNAIKDFRKEAGSSISTDYSNFNREKTYKVSSTRYKNTITSPDNTFSSDLVGNLGEDLIDLSFLLLSPDTETTPIRFRAYIEDWNDGVKADWASVKYLGRAENFYKYNGWSRSAGVTFLIPVLSKQDLIPLYSRLNQLMWSVAPSYSPVSDLNVSGVMRGTITYVNIGDYFSNVPSIINNVGITQIGDMGWDIGRDSIGTYDAGPQLPKGLKVQLDFTPIHDFVPQYGEAFIATRSILGIPDPVIADPIITDFPLTDPIIL